MLTEPMMKVTVGCETNKWPGPEAPESVDGISLGLLEASRARGRSRSTELGRVEQVWGFCLGGGGGGGDCGEDAERLLQVVEVTWENNFQDVVRSWLVCH